MINKKLFSRKKSSQAKLIPASSGESMLPLVHWIKNYSTLKPTNIFEIGANLAQDADVLRREFQLQDKDVWVFEPHPRLIKYIKDNYSFNAFDFAVFNKDNPVTINAIDINKNDNSGISSLRAHKDVSEDNFYEIKVSGIRMDTFMQKYDIKKIDLLKVDVEGCNHEVIEGFGEELKNVSSIHIEAEHYEHWLGQKLWPDIHKLLVENFEMVYFERHMTQSDSFWIKKEYIRKT